MLDCKSESERKRCIGNEKTKKRVKYEIKGVEEKEIEINTERT